jgi:hypothetical protein
MKDFDADMPAILRQSYSEIEYRVAELCRQDGSDEPLAMDMLTECKQCGRLFAGLACPYHR